MRFAIVLAFAAIGEWIAERAGTMNISVEGMILTGAFTAAVVYDLTGNDRPSGSSLGVRGGLIVAARAGHDEPSPDANQFVVGLTLNVLVVGLTAFVDAQIEPVAQIGQRRRGAGAVDLPLIGQALFGQTWPQYLLYAVVPLAWWLVYRTRWGLEARAGGENPQAGDVSGIDVNHRRRQAIYVCGIFAGLGGGS